MTNSHLHTFEWLSGVEAAMTLVMLLVFILQSRRVFPRTLFFVSVKFGAILLLAPLSYIRMRPFTIQTQYGVYFYFYWLLFILESIAGFLVITELFQLSLEPLPGLRRLGMLVFRWVAAISILIALTSAISPDMNSRVFITALASGLQRTISLLELCLLVFLYIIAKPLGMSYRSRLLGLSVGLGVMSLAALLHSAWIGQNSSMWASVNLFYSAAPSIGMFIWLVHFLLPEPERVPIMLPVKSPLMRWNDIAEALGKSGGRMLLTHKEEIAGKDFAALDHAASLLKRDAS